LWALDWVFCAGSYMSTLQPTTSASPSAPLERLITRVSPSLRPPPPPPPPRCFLAAECPCEGDFPPLLPRAHPDRGRHGQPIPSSATMLPCFASFFWLTSRCCAQVKYSQEPGNPTKCKISPPIYSCSALVLRLRRFHLPVVLMVGCLALSVQRPRPWAGIWGSTSRCVAFLQHDGLDPLFLWGLIGSYLLLCAFDRLMIN
jgi:hypothetical protein